MSNVRCETSNVKTFKKRKSGVKRETSNLGCESFSPEGAQSVSDGRQPIERKAANHKPRRGAIMEDNAKFQSSNAKKKTEAKSKAKHEFH